MIRTYISERILVRTHSYRCMYGHTNFKLVRTHVVRTMYVNMYAHVYRDYVKICRYKSYVYSTYNMRTYIFKVRTTVHTPIRVCMYKRTF